MTDKLFLVAFVVLMGWGLYRFGVHHATSDIRSQSKRIDTVLRSEAEKIKSADQKAIEDAKLAEIERNAAEDALRRVKKIDACKPVPIECLAGLRTNRVEAGVDKASPKVPAKQPKSP